MSFQENHEDVLQDSSLPFITPLISDSDICFQSETAVLSSLDVFLNENGSNSEELFTIGIHRVGLFKSGINESTIPEIAAAYGDVTIKEVDLNTEGMFSPAIEITFPGEPSAGIILEIYHDNLSSVYRIEVFSDRFRTSDGIGVSSTVADLQEFFDFQVDYIDCAESGNPFIFIEEMEASIVLVPGDWWVMCKLQGELPPETEVKAILIL